MFEMYKDNDLTKDSCVFVIEHPSNGLDSGGEIVAYKFSNK